MAKRVSQAEKEEMWKLYQQLGTFIKVAKKMNRSPDTVSRYVREYEAAVQAASVILIAQGNSTDITNVVDKLI